MIVKEGFTSSAAARSSQIAPYPSNFLDRWALARIQAFVKTAPIRFALWDGFELSPDTGPPVATMVFKERSALYGWMWDPELNFGETYMSGLVEIEGDLLELLEAIYRSFTRPRRPWWLWQGSNDTRAARENVHHHYDIGNDFYRLWLDDEMVYTCAYFPTPEVSLEEAQVAKLDLVCRKLHLKPGETVIEAGCGWGSLALYMARHYGVSVRAFNISSEQIAYARARAEREGLDDRVEFILDDYRYVQGTCDAFVSVGMLEHVGASDYPTLGRVMDRTLSTNGRGLLHFIGRDRPAPLDSETDFPWRLRTDSAGSLQSRARTVFVLRDGRAQPSLALRENARALGAAFRRREPPGAGHVRRDIRTRVEAVLDGLAGIVLDRFPAVVPGCLCARQYACDPVDARRRLTSESFERGHLRGVDRGRRTGRFRLRLETSPGWPRRHRHGQGRLPSGQGLRWMDHATGRPRSCA
jgi:2-polyprenyl-3-methyl-5-hydroxy-6-metoxy-1,4-benzoquinol methylase